MRFLNVIIPLVMLSVFILLSSDTAGPVIIANAQPTGWVELVGERTRTGKVFFDPSRPGITAVDVNVAKIHYDGPNWKDIDNTVVPSLANVPTLGLVDLEMTTDDYEFYALQTLNTIPSWFYRNKSAPDTYVTFNPQGAQWTNDLDQIDLISMPQSVVGMVTENSLHWEDAYGPGINLTLSAQPGRLSKILTLKDIPQAPAQYIIDGGNPTLELMFIFDTPSGPNSPDIWVDDVLWDESARTETVGTIDFRVDGETTFSFAKPTAFDSGFGVANPSFVLTKQGPNLLVAIRVPLAFLENAVYPVFIDPTVDLQVTASLDDGYNRAPNLFRDTLTYLIAGLIPSVCDIWSRFLNVAIDQGATIDVAYITVEAPSTSVNDDDGVRTNIYANDVDDAVAPIDYTDMDTKVRTTAFTAWDLVTFADDTPTNSPSIVSVIQEVTDRGGWSTGSDLMILVDDDGSDSNKFYRWKSQDEGGGDAPRLHVEWTGAWVNTAPDITNPITTETVDSNTSYNRSFSATDPDTNQTLQWELNGTSTPFTITVWNAGNRTTYVTATPNMTGSFWVNITVGDDATTGNSTDYVNYTLIVQEPALTETETLLETTLFFMVGFIPFLLLVGIGFWKEQGSMLIVAGLVGTLLGLWVIVTIYWVFGMSFVGISILFAYIGWVNTEMRNI